MAETKSSSSSLLLPGDATGRGGLWSVHRTTKSLAVKIIKRGRDNLHCAWREQLKRILRKSEPLRDEAVEYWTDRRNSGAWSSSRAWARAARDRRASCSVRLYIGRRDYGVGYIFSGKPSESSKRGFMRCICKATTATAPGAFADGNKSSVAPIYFPRWHGHPVVNERAAATYCYVDI